MRLTKVAVLVVVTGNMTAAAAARDWRVMPDIGGHDSAFVDAESVVRRSDGRLRFRGQLRLNEGPSNSDFGYDRVDLQVDTICGVTSGRGGTSQVRRRYSYRGRPVPEPGWQAEEMVENVGWMADQICRGVIGPVRFASVDAAMASGEREGFDGPMAEYVSPEVELVGTVVQGFELNGISLCGSEDRCRDGAPTEFCWLAGSAINVPVPAGASEWSNGGPRRDSADFAFRGRIKRSVTGDGYGHVGASGCEVEVTGPVRAVSISQRRTDPPLARQDAIAATGRSEAAAIAHRELETIISASGPLTIRRGERSWDADAVVQDSIDTRGTGACTTMFRFGGAWLPGAGTALGWNWIDSLDVDGRTLTIARIDYDENLHFYLETPALAARLKPFVERLAQTSFASVAQAGRRVTLGYADGRLERMDYEDAGAAIQAAGMAYRLRGREIARVTQDNASLYASPVDRVILSFADEAKAAAAAQAMRALLSICTSAAGLND